MADNGSYQSWDEARRALVRTHLAELLFSDLALMANVVCPHVLKGVISKHLLSKDWEEIKGIRVLGTETLRTLRVIVCAVSDKLSTDPGLADRIAASDVEHVLSQLEDSGGAKLVGEPHLWDRYREIVRASRYGSCTVRQLAKVAGKKWTSSAGSAPASHLLDAGWGKLVRVRGVGEGGRELFYSIVADVVAILDEESSNMAYSEMPPEPRGRKSDRIADASRCHTDSSAPAKLWESTRVRLLMTKYRDRGIRDLAKAAGKSWRYRDAQFGDVHVLHKTWEELKEIEGVGLGKMHFFLEVITVLGYPSTQTPKHALQIDTYRAPPRPRPAKDIARGNCKKPCPEQPPVLPDELRWGEIEEMLKNSPLRNLTLRELSRLGGKEWMHILGDTLVRELLNKTWSELCALRGLGKRKRYLLLETLIRVARESASAHEDGSKEAILIVSRAIIWDRYRERLLHHPCSGLPLSEFALLAGHRWDFTGKDTPAAEFLEMDWWRLRNARGMGRKETTILLEIVQTLAEPAQECVNSSGFEESTSKTQRARRDTRRWDNVRGVVQDSEYSKLPLSEFAVLGGQKWHGAFAEMVMGELLSLTWPEVNLLAGIGPAKAHALLKMVAKVSKTIEGRDTRASARISASLEMREVQREEGLWDACRIELLHSESGKLPMRDAAKLVGSKPTSILGNISVNEMLAIRWAEYRRRRGMTKAKLHILLNLAVALAGIESPEPDNGRDNNAQQQARKNHVGETCSVNHD